MPRAPISIGFISLGCAKNRVDSQVMADAVLAAGLRLAPSPEEADVVVVNTCAFIDEARAESMDMIREACALKWDGICRAVLVAGCLSQRYRASLAAELPDVDGFIGLDELDSVAAVAGQLAEGKKVTRISGQATRLFEQIKPGVVFSGGAYAYLKVAEGCDHFCSFCAIPLIRGRYRSRNISSLVQETEGLLGRGFREISLISQDITSYGSDLKDGSSLQELLKALSSIGGKFWIRLLYGYPSHLTDELLETMASLPQVCHYLDLPVQHSHPEILRAMGRGETVEAVGTMASRIRKFMPDAAIRTTCLAGFPGETDEHFRHLLEFVKNGEFDHLGVFAYSPEEGTRALAMPDRPSRGIADERRAVLMEEQRKVVDRKAAALVGVESEVLLEQLAEHKKKGSIWLARSQRQAPEVDGSTIVRKVPAAAGIGDFMAVRFDGFDEYDMTAISIEM